MVSKEDTFYIKIVALSEIYKFIVLNFHICGPQPTLKTNIKFLQRINHVSKLIFL